MYHVVYTSTATVAVSEKELEDALARWRRNNARDGITGVLLFSKAEGHFMQVLEGEKAEILALFANIKHDYRHRDLLKLADGPIVRRNFTSWLMGFKVLNTAAFAQLAGYADPTGPAFQQALARTHDELIRPLLAAFIAETSFIVPDTPTAEAPGQPLR